MLNASTAVLAALDDFETVLYLTIDINWPVAAGGTERITDYHSDITIDGNIYNSNGGIISYSRPSARSVVSRNQFSLELENNSNARNTQIDAARSGVPITVRLNFEHPQTGSRIGDIEVYTGVSTSAQIAIGRNGGQILRLDYSGQVENLNEVKGRFTTQSSQQAVDSTDTSMDYAHDPDGELTLLWGRV